jgi:uncharacterized coiled-coil protein SlyX
MSTEDLERRIAKLEEAYDDLESTLIKLNTTLALLNQTVENIAKAEDKKQQLMDRSILFVVGGFISATVAWIVRGGLDQ